MNFVLLLSLLCSVSLVSCAQITVKDGLDCSAILVGCWFEDPSIWVNDTVPGPNDDVFIFSNSTTFGKLFLSSNMTYQVGSLNLYNASFGVSGSRFTTNSIYIDSSSSISVVASATLTANTSLTLYGSITLYSYGVLNNGGTPGNALFDLKQNSSLTAGDHSYFNWDGYCNMYGNLGADDSSTLYCQNMALLYSTPNVLSPLLASNLTVLNYAPVVIPNGFLGDFVNLIAPSTTTIYNRFAAQVQVRYPTPPTRSLKQDGPYALLELINISNAQITAKLYSDMAGISGPATLFISNSVANISCPNSAYPDYWLYSLVLANSTAIIDNLWVTSASLSNSSSLQLWRALKTDAALSIDSTSSFSLSQGLAWVQGTIINQGQLDLVNSILELNGSYVQQESGVLKVDLINDSTGSLEVNGSITLAGSLQYTIQTAPFYKKTQTYLVATYNSVNGSFAGNAKPLSNSAVKRDLDIQLGNNQITVVYKFDSKDIPYWIWIIVAVGGAALIALVAFVIIRLRRKSKYQSI